MKGVGDVTKQAGTAPTWFQLVPVTWGHELSETRNLDFKVKSPSFYSMAQILNKQQKILCVSNKTHL